MADDALGGDVQAGEERSEEPLQRVHLRRRKGHQPGVGQLDPDRAGIDIVTPRPCARARMPGAHLLIDQRADPARLRDQVMRRDLARGIAKHPFGGLAIRHRSVVDHHKFGPQPIAPLGEIWRQAHWSRAAAAALRKTLGSHPQA